MATPMELSRHEGVERSRADAGWLPARRLGGLVV